MPVEASIAQVQHLCEALSDIFVDNVVDYHAIAAQARAFPTRHVEQLFFEWVAPVCYANALAPVPSVWAGFEPQLLWQDICHYRQYVTGGGWLRRQRVALHVFFLRQRFAADWRELRGYLP
ncbi:hypothetical protein GBN32_00395 [Plesiomonas shigelloides]|nr:hypothetical protein GBN32_00395 [Plesiomonas shigelloides]